MDKKTKIAVIYKSKYGSTRRYAEWIAKKTDADLYDLDAVDQSVIQEYSVIVFGSSVHAGKIKRAGFIVKNWDTLKKKKVVVFTASGAPPHDPGQQKVFAASLPEELRQHVSYFPMQGAYDYNRLSPGDKLLMHFPKLKLIVKAVFKKDSKARDALKNWYRPQDWTNESAVKPIIRLVKEWA